MQWSGNNQRLCYQPDDEAVINARIPCSTGTTAGLATKERLHRQRKTKPFPGPHAESSRYFHFVRERRLGASGTCRLATLGCRAVLGDRRTNVLLQL